MQAKANQMSAAMVEILDEASARLAERWLRLRLGREAAARGRR